MDIAAQQPPSGPAEGTDPPTTDRTDPPTTAVPEAAAPPPGPPAPPTPPPPALRERVAAYRLRRSRTDKMLGGVCGGLAADLGVDPALGRIAVLALTLLTGGAFALVYLAAWIVAPAA